MLFAELGDIVSRPAMAKRLAAIGKSTVVVCSMRGDRLAGARLSPALIDAGMRRRRAGHRGRHDYRGARPRRRCRGLFALPFVV